MGDRRKTGQPNDIRPGEPGQDGSWMGYILKRRQSKKKVKQHRAGSAVGWVTVGKRDSRRRSPGEPCQVGTWMGVRLKRRHSKKKVKQHRARSAVGWVTAGNEMAEHEVQMHQERSELRWVTTCRGDNKGKRSSSTRLGQQWDG